MDARETLAGWMATSKGGKYVFPGDYDQADDLFATLASAGFTILHDSENHGPTRDRAAKTVANMVWYKNASDAHFLIANGPEDYATAIRAMEVKP